MYYDVSTEGDLLYTVEDGSVTIIDYIGKETTLDIPYGYPVTEIDWYAFEDCNRLTGWRPLFQRRENTNRISCAKNRKLYDSQQRHRNR